MDRFKIDGRIYILLSVLAFLVPLKWLTAWLLAVIFHEACHLLALKSFGGNMYSFSIGLGGANIICTDLTDKEYLISILAGPVGGLFPVVFGRWFPRLAICSWMLSVYNLLPILPLDGGRAMRIFIKDDRYFRTLEQIVIGIIFLVAVYGWFFADLGPVLVVIATSIWRKNRKRPCKGPSHAVQ